MTDYLANEDIFGQWIEDCFTVEFDSRITNKELLDLQGSGVATRHEAGFRGSKTVSAELMKRGFVKYHTNGERGFGACLNVVENIETRW